jgi:REP element-mobilizing transposase RayT
MSRPSRPSDPRNAKGKPGQFFVTSSTAAGKSILQSERMASLFIDVLRTYTRSEKFIVRDFVVMPDHVHVLMTVPGDLSLEKPIQLMKGSFSFRAKKELGFHGECGNEDSRMYALSTRKASGNTTRIHRRESGEGWACDTERGLQVFVV